MLPSRTYTDISQTSLRTFCLSALQLFGFPEQLILVSNKPAGLTISGPAGVAVVAFSLWDTRTADMPSNSTDNQSVKRFHPFLAAYGLAHSPSLFCPNLHLLSISSNHHLRSPGFTGLACFYTALLIWLLHIIEGRIGLEPIFMHSLVVCGNFRTECMISDYQGLKCLPVPPPPHVPNGYYPLGVPIPKLTKPRGRLPRGYLHILLLNSNI